MNTLSYRPISANKETVSKEWIVVDAKDKVLGRLCSQIASILKGKNKTNYTPHVDCGDNVIVINAEKVKLTGKKMTDKQYIRHTGYPGGQRVNTAIELLKKHPERLVEKSVKGMLPKNKLGSAVYRNLRVFVGGEHNLEAQKPEKINIDSIK